MQNRIHSLLKERLYGFTREAIFGSRQRIRALEAGSTMHVQINHLPDTLERNEAELAALKDRIVADAEPFMA